MANNTNNKYVIPSLPGVDPQTRRVIQDLADRMNYLQGELEEVRRVASDVMGLAKAADPSKGIITIPAPNGNGFIRVNKDGVIESYTNPVQPSYEYPLALSIGETSISTPATESILRQYTFKAGSLPRNSHITVKMGGFAIDTGPGVINNIVYLGRFGSAGLASPAFFNSGNITPAAQISQFYFELNLSHDSDPIEFIGVGGFSIHKHAGGGSVVDANRGEIAADFTVDNTLYMTANITSTVTPVVVSEMFEINQRKLITNG